MRIDKRRKYMLVVDVETTNGFSNPLVYDIGFAVVDKMGRIYEKESFLVKEIFDNKNLMRTAYYIDKYPLYLDGIAKGEFERRYFFEIREIIFSIMKLYNINEVWAYNCNFDRNALNSTTKYLSEDLIDDYFPPCEFHCIWNFACSTILQQKTFFKNASEKEWVSEKGNVRTSAEISYRYITSENDFEEEHTGLQDVLIESAILAKCIAQHKKADTTLRNDCWRKPQPKFREYVGLL